MTKKILQTVLLRAVIFTGTQVTVNAEPRVVFDPAYRLWQQPAMPESSGAVPDTSGKQWPHTGPGHAVIDPDTGVTYYEAE